jgi:hypothetical protein
VNLLIYAPGSVVRLKGGPTATVLEVHVCIGLAVEYSVAWWTEEQRYVERVAAFEVAGLESGFSCTVGFHL